MKSATKSLRLLAFLGLLLTATGAAAQSAPAFTRFNFANPGARSLGFGGAFAALADDATAAWANPAGLVQLLRPEVSLEVRGNNFTAPETSLRTVSEEPGVSGVGFAAFVYPRNRWSVAVYRNVWADLPFGGTVSQGFVGALPGVPDAFVDWRAFSSLEIENTGLSFAYRVTETLSVGLGLSHFEGELFSSSALAFYDPSELSPTVPVRRTFFDATTADESDLGLNAGVLWHFAERWSVGAFYRQGPELVLSVVAGAGPSAEFPEPVILASEPDLPFGLPDVAGAGVAYRSPNGAATVSFEWDFVQYSSVTRDLRPVAVTGRLEVDDGHELRLGFEYAFLERTPLIALRLGIWRDPDHVARSVDADPALRELFPGGSDEPHAAAGLGFAFKRLKLDLAYDHSDAVKTGSISAVYSF